MTLVAQRRAWRGLFAAALFAIVLFAAWIAAAVVTGVSPLSLLRPAGGPGRRSPDTDPPVVPMSYYIGSDSGVRAITPDDNRISSVNRNGRRISVAPVNTSA